MAKMSAFTVKAEVSSLLCWGHTNRIQNMHAEWQLSVWMSPLLQGLQRVSGDGPKELHRGTESRDPQLHSTRQINYGGGNWGREQLKGGATFLFAGSTMWQEKAIETEVGNLTQNTNQQAKQILTNGDLKNMLIQKVSLSLLHLRLK